MKRIDLSKPDLITDPGQRIAVERGAEEEVEVDSVADIEGIVSAVVVVEEAVYSEADGDIGEVEKSRPLSSYVYLATFTAHGSVLPCTGKIWVAN